MVDGAGGCSERTEDEMRTRFYNSSVFPSDAAVTGANFDKAHAKSRECPPGYTNTRRLEPHLRCADEFALTDTAGDGSIIKLESEMLGDAGPTGDYCLYFDYASGNVIAETCTEVIVKHKF